MRGLLAALLLLSACSAVEPRPVPQPTIGACQADRGIGGTGQREADRGIGGTGIVGVVTGFGSICLAGQEVAIPPGLAPVIDGQPAEIADLRAGQFAAVTVDGSGAATRIEVRRLVVGPVQPGHGPGAVLVAGQVVRTDDAPAPGAWVAVSGLRAPDGVIAATRIDPAPIGPVLVRGDVAGPGAAPRIGRLRVRLAPGTAAPRGPVVASGTLVGGVLAADRVAPDPAERDPVAFFGPEIHRFIVDGYVMVVPGGLTVGGAFVGGDFGPPRDIGRAIVRFERAAGGGLVGVGLRTFGAP